MALTIEEVIVVEGTTGVVDKVTTAAAMVLEESKATVVLVSGGYGRHLGLDYTCNVKPILSVKIQTYAFGHCDTHNTFKEACYALGLLQDDKEFIDAILEANLHLSDEHIMNLTLAKIEHKMQVNGRSLKEFPAMLYPSLDLFHGLKDRLLLDEVNFDRSLLKQQYMQSLKTMTDEQRYAFDTIVDSINNDRGGFFFLYGYGGTGKTCGGNIVLNVASSGITSLLLPNGCTAHSRFKIPLSINEDSICNIKLGTPICKLSCKAKLIIWDEALMLSKYCYKTLDKSLKDILHFQPSFNPNLPFDGKVVVLGGDFRQILPVIPMGSRQDIVQACISSSYLWDFCAVLKLSKNMRLTAGGMVEVDDDIKAFAD
ncbi:uncharacterized protein LOC130966238 [Arachis stenosperma]|uniref:uncharacterized protein LOC130966238 n=1 Tax=Arachis stenosperma TaxID=217475 RepID=UPI0025ABC320|nr:uncharacterized protein LOC130966238 [Arachis stenosperma]